MQATEPAEVGAALPPTKGERTRARILEVAIAHFAEHGHDNASLPEIAREVGVSHSALYQHFGKKGDLFATAVDADLSSLFNEVVSVIEDLPGGDTAERLVSLLPRLALSSAHHPLARRVLADLTDDVVRALDGLPAMDSFRSQVIHVIEVGQDNDDIRGDLDVEQTADGLITVTLALLSAFVRLDDSVSSIPRADSTLAFLTNVLRAPPTTSRARGRRQH